MVGYRVTKGKYMLKYLVLLVAALTLNAQEGPKKPRTGGPDPVPPHLRPERPKLTEEQKKQRSELVAKYDANKDGKMIHRYVVDPNYDNDIKNNYYLNDDTKVNNIRLVFHPYQIKSRAYYGSTDPPPLPEMPSAIQMFLLRLRLLGIRV